MHFEANEVYHVYNRGNNKVKIFLSPDNYLFFLRKVKNEWLPYCDIFCYCLMPNHFHFMLQPNEAGCKNITLKDKVTHLQNLSKSIGKTLSSYTQAINIQNGRIGTLFQKKTKAKCLTESTSQIKGYITSDYLINCFFYIHNNPLEAKLINKLENWPYSSYLDYYGFRSGKLCSISKAIERIGISKNDLKADKIIVTDNKVIENIW